jgi:hypothetical protein
MGSAGMRAFAAGLLLACSVAASAADGGAPAFDPQVRGAAAAVGEATERSLTAELGVCGGDVPAISKSAPGLLKAWRKRNKPWLAASLAVRAELRASLLGADPAQNGAIFDRDFDQAIAGVAQRGADRLRAIADPAQRKAACETLVSDVREGRRDVDGVNANATAMLRHYLDR